MTPVTTRNRALTESISINATPQKVWELITRIDTIPTWYDSWDTVETGSADPFLRKGTTFRLIGNHRHRVIADCEVTELSEGRRLQWRQITSDTPITTVTFDLVLNPADATTELRQTRTWSLGCRP